MKKVANISSDPSFQGKSLQFLLTPIPQAAFAICLEKYSTWPWLVRVQRVQLHPSIWINGCMHPSIFKPDITFRLICMFFPANNQILHPSIEISNKGTE